MSQRGILAGRNLHSEMQPTDIGLGEHRSVGFTDGLIRSAIVFNRLAEEQNGWYDCRQ
jgi:hypothetical protein